MADIIDFVKTEVKHDLVIKNKRKVDPVKYALHLLSTLENYSNHFWNNYQLSEQVSEYSAKEFDSHIEELSRIVKTNLRQLASARLYEIIRNDTSYSQEMLNGLEFMYKKEFVSLLQWFEQIGIPMPKNEVLSISKFKDVWV
jgi:hypothetical protein